MFCELANSPESYSVEVKYIDTLLQITACVKYFQTCCRRTEVIELKL